MIIYTVYATIEARDAENDDCWHPGEERDLAEFDTIDEAENFLAKIDRLKTELADYKQAVHDDSKRVANLKRQLAAKDKEIKGLERIVNGYKRKIVRLYDTLLHLWPYKE